VPRKTRTPTEGETLEALGHRLAQLRKDRGLTQVELAARLGLTQSFVSQCERGELRLHGELIVELAKLFDVSADEILGLKAPKRSGSARNRRLLRRIQQIDALPKRDQQALLRTIDAFLAKSA
jgi:transcriptional regulator with XRE-family HTH domain